MYSLIMTRQKLIMFTIDKYCFLNKCYCVKLYLSVLIYPYLMTHNGMTYIMEYTVGG